MDWRKRTLTTRLSTPSILVVSILLLVGMPSTAGTVTHHPASPINSSAAPSILRVTNQEFNNSLGVDALASIGHTVLSVQILNNFVGYDIVLSNLSKNTSRIVPGSFVGSSQAFPVGSVAAGDHQFLIFWRNLSTGNTSLQSISLNGTLRNTTTTWSHGFTWLFLAANQSRLWVGGYNLGFDIVRLLELNAKTLRVTGNYSSSLPRHVDLYSVLEYNGSLFLAGSEPVLNGTATAPYFGVLDLHTRTITPHNAVARHWSTNLTGVFETLIESGGRVFVGGEYQAHLAVPYFDLTLGQYLYRFDPGTGVLANISAILPSGGVNGGGIYNLEPLGRNIAVVDYGVISNATVFVESCYTYVLSHHGHTLTNITASMPPRLVAAAYMLTASAGEPFVSGGTDTANGLGELAAVWA